MRRKQSIITLHYNKAATPYFLLNYRTGCEGKVHHYTILLHKVHKGFLSYNFYFTTEQHMREKVYHYATLLFYTIYMASNRTTYSEGTLTLHWIATQTSKASVLRRHLLLQPTHGAGIFDSNTTLNTHRSRKESTPGNQC